MKYPTSEITAKCTVHAVKPLPAELADVQDWPTSEPAKEVVRSLWPELNYINRLPTAWGNKTAIGLAASIDNIIELPQLLASHARLVVACVGLLDAYAPNAQITVDKSGEDSLHSSVRQARAALAAAKVRVE